MELSSDVMRPSDLSAIQLYIVDQVKRDGKTKYVINCLHMGSRAKWAVEHRYSEFLELRDKLHVCVKYARHRCPGCVSYSRMLDRFQFPPKKLIHKTERVVTERSLQLTRFMSNIMSHTFTTTPKCRICGGAAFEMTKEFLLCNASSISDAFTMAAIAESLTPRAFFLEYCRSASKIECYKGRTIIKVVQVQRVPLATLTPPPPAPRVSIRPPPCDEEENDSIAQQRRSHCDMLHIGLVTVM
ncbi:Aste57867_21052 [Aphanomyces stellatus]|uniref:Aste57867_21052 protein n=1 Tax=Aphanomyces stellatus TaxID=120398 RepID=A0A485LGM5_9STRA|nr:hypothetical protein As57867_020984 [Aphanomyces stellatus]VFT97727.1 Aste57867_21052 [Aphanomyces stellatus]